MSSINPAGNNYSCCLIMKGVSCRANLSLCNAILIRKCAHTSLEQTQVLPSLAASSMIVERLRTRYSKLIFSRRWRSAWLDHFLYVKHCILANNEILNCGLA